MSFNTNAVIIIIYFFQTRLIWDTQILTVNLSPDSFCKEDAKSLLITTDWNNANEKYTCPKGLLKDKIKRKELLNY